MAPKISIITPNKNGGRFLRETIESVLRQDYADYEHIVVDGASTDDSIDILKSYPHLRWISEPDERQGEAFRKGLAMALGDYIMITCASDGYLSRTWFRRCVEVLEGDPEVSIVWGLAVQMTEEGDLQRVWGYDFFDRPPPQKQGFLAYWLATRILYPDLNHCIRRKIYLENFPRDDRNDPIARYNPFLGAMYNLNVNGYLPYFLPILAHFGRTHQGQLTVRNRENEAKGFEIYNWNVAQYYRDLVRGRKTHVFRDGASRPIGVLSRREALRLPLLRVWHRTVRKRVHGMRRALKRRLRTG